MTAVAFSGYTFDYSYSEGGKLSETSQELIITKNEESSNQLYIQQEDVPLDAEVNSTEAEAVNTIARNLDLYGDFSNVGETTLNEDSGKFNYSLLPNKTFTNKELKFEPTKSDLSKGKLVFIA